MAVFRIEKTRDYTVMSNHHLKDRTLTLKSKGLLSMMLSLPDEWNYTTRGLAAICREGVDSIGAALKELETHGYIRRTQLRDEKGKITDTEYVIYEMPQCEPPSSPGTPLPGTAKPYTENPDMGVPDTAEPCTENPAQLNTNQTKTDLSSTEISNPTSGMRPRRKKRTSSHFWTLSMPVKPERMTKLIKARWTCSFLSWRNGSRTTLPSSSTANSRWLPARP